MSTIDRTVPTGDAHVHRIADHLNDEAISRRFVRRYAGFLREQLADIPTGHPLHGEFTTQLHDLRDVTGSAVDLTTLEELPAAVVRIADRRIVGEER